jgi:hypothetical protein
MIQGRCHPRDPFRHQRIRTVLGAAAMDHTWFNPGERFCRALGSTEALINVQNRHDVPLFFHRTRDLFATQALGKVGLTCRDERQLGEVSCRVTDYDVTSLLKCHHLWPHYYNEPSIACAIRHHVYFDD